MGDGFPIPFGRYQLIERLAMGGMAELFLAQSTGAHGFEKTVVIKRILPHLARNDHFTSMFIDEAKITAQLAHPKIAQTYELGTEGKQLFIAMEYVDGLDVLAILRECAHRRTRLQPHISVYIVKEVLDALDFAHQVASPSGEPLGIVHRDVSPSNILVSRRGDVKLVDFGIAHAIVSEHETRAGTLKGKYGYMSPEQVLGQGVTVLSDVFSAAIVLAEMLMGRRLFAASAELDVLLMVRDVKLARLEKYGQHVEKKLMVLLRKALSKDPAERFASAAHFRDALDEWLFQERQRVGPSNLSDVVEALYDAAMDRRRQQIAEAPPQEEPEVALGSDPKQPELGAISDSEPVIELTEQPGDDIAALDLELGGVDEQEAAIEELSRSAGYPSIEQALAAVSPQEIDPSAVDFDDSAVDSAEHQLEGRRSKLVPTVADVAKSKAPAPPSLESITDTPSEAGEIRVHPAIALLYRFASERATGLVVAAIGGIRKEIYLTKGVPEFVSSNVAGELFGNYLVSRKVVSEGELHMSLAMMPHYGGKLGDTLVGLGLMKPLDVFRHLTEQVRTRLIDVCTWPKGSYEYYAGRTNPREAFPLDLDPYEVIGAGAMALKADYIDRWFDTHREDKLRAIAHPKVLPEAYKLGPSLRRNYDHLRGDKSLSQLAARYSNEKHRLDFLRHCFLMFATDLAEPA